MKFNGFINLEMEEKKYVFQSLVDSSEFGFFKESRLEESFRN